MTTPRDLERRLVEHLHGEAPSRAPDWILRSALTTIDTTRQRRGLTALRRNLDMPTYAKMGAAAVVVIAVGALALWRFAPPPDEPGTPTLAPTAVTGPTARPSTAPTAGPDPTTYVPGALTRTFTSDLHGISLSYPEGWTVQPATEPWTEGPPPVFSDATGDKLHDAALQSNLFLTVVSRPLNGASLDAFATGLSREECTLKPGGTINGADRVLLATPSTDCVNDFALASGGGRAYVFELRASADDVELRTLDTAALLDAILATVQLQPEDAVDQ
jgi:hypothetical protein